MGIEISGIKAEDALDAVFAPGISGIIANAGDWVSGGDGGRATVVFIGAAGVVCRTVEGKEATALPGVSENFTNMGLETKWSVEFTEALIR